MQYRKEAIRQNWYKEGKSNNFCYCKVGIAITLREREKSDGAIAILEHVQFDLCIKKLFLIFGVPILFSSIIKYKCIYMPHNIQYITSEVLYKYACK